MATVRELITKIIFHVDDKDLKKADKATTKFSSDAKKAGQTADNSIKKASASFGKLSGAVGTATNGLGRLRQRLQAINNQRVTPRVDIDTSRAESKLSRLRHNMQQVNSQRVSGSRVTAKGGGNFGAELAGAAGLGALTAGTIAGAGVIAAGAATAGAVKKFADFDATMSRVKALTSATDGDMQRLTDTAQQLGATTKYSATEAAEAMTYLGMAGWKTNEIIKAMPGMLDLAAASGEDLARVADIVSDDLTAFKMTADQAGHFADVLAVASTNANTNVSMMGETFKYVGPLAGSLGFSIEDMALATGIMANSSIKGEQAGTTLRALITRLVKPTKEAAAAMDMLGLSVTDGNGKMKPFRQIIDDMRKGFAKLSEAEKGEVAAMLAGQEAMSGTLALVNENQKTVDSLTNSLDHAQGAAGKMAATMNDNLIGSMTELGSAAEAVALKFGKVFEPSIRKAVKKAQKSLAGISKSMSDYEIIVRARTLSKQDGITTDELEEYRQQNNVDELESKHPYFMEALPYLERFKAYLDEIIDSMQQRFSPIFERLGQYFDTVMGEKWQAVKENMLEGLKSLGQAWENIQPFLEVLANLVGVVLIWAFRGLMVVGSAAFRAIAGVIEIASEILGDFGAGVQKVTGWLQDLINWAIEALSWLGIIEKKTGGLGGAVDNMVSGWMGNKSVTVNNNISQENKFPPLSETTIPKVIKNVMPNPPAVSPYF